MKFFSIAIVLLCLLYSCNYPRYIHRDRASQRTKFELNLTELPPIDRYHFSAIERVRFSQKIKSVIDNNDFAIEQKLENVLRSTFAVSQLVNSEELSKLNDPLIRRRKILKVLKNKDGFENNLIPIICYQFSRGEIRETGGVMFNTPTGNDQYLIGYEVYIALYQNSELVFLNNSILYDEKIVPTGTPITHEFPQHVLDTLMHMALEPLLEQMEKNGSKQQKP